MSMKLSLVYLILLVSCSERVSLDGARDELPQDENDGKERLGRDSFADVGFNPQTFAVLNYQGYQIYIYSAISNENENKLMPQKWVFFYVPITTPEQTHNKDESWIWVHKTEIRMKIVLGNDDVREKVREAIVNKYPLETMQYSKYWDVSPLMIDSLTAFIVKGSNSPVEGVHPYRFLHPNTLMMTFRFVCSSEEHAQQVMEKIIDSDYDIEVVYYFAGLKQLSTNFISISGDQLKSVLSKTIADGGTTSAQYIHRNQASKFASSYFANVKKMIYSENTNTNMSMMTNGLEEQFISLMQQGMNAAQQTILDAKLFDQVWSSTDLNPDRLTSELSKLFTYNETETKRRNDTNIYFDLNKQHLESSSTNKTGNGNVGLTVPGIFTLGTSGGGTSSTSNSLQDILLQTNHDVYSLDEIERYLTQQQSEFEWNGEKFIPKSFSVYKLTDISDRLQVAIMAKQLIAEKSNGAMIRTINTLSSPFSSSESRLQLILTGSIQLYSGKAPPPLPWLLCNGTAVSRIEYQRLFSIIGESFGLGDGKTTFNLPDFRGRVPVGVDELSVRATYAARLGVVGGNAEHQMKVEQLPAHNHEKGTITLSTNGLHSHVLSDPGHSHNSHDSALSDSVHRIAKWGDGFGEIVVSRTTGSSATNIQIDAAGDHSHTISGETALTGFGQQFSLLQPFQAVNYIIYSD